jgi:hypothetical protein
MTNTVATAFVTRRRLASPGMLLGLSGRSSIEVIAGPDA